jgi:CDP-diglyceride synthetase
MAHASFLNDLPYAVEALLFTIIVTAIGETFGLVGGVLFGKHRVTRISPGKTLEGYICTILASIAASCAFEGFLPAVHPGILSVLAFILLNCHVQRPRFPFEECSCTFYRY